jgi:methionyl-tRNA formyltransferase
MRIFIITMDDPVQTKDFIKHIIDARKDEIIGLAVPNGDRLTLSKGKSKYEYLMSLLLIMGVYSFIKNVFISVFHKIKKIAHKYSLVSDPTIIGYAKENNITTYKITTPNSKKFREKLIDLKPDIIINQSQNIIKKELLAIPTIGVLNRHNALLPKNRGRLTPFWVLYKQEKETGVSIHFVEEGLDSGDIIVQKKYRVEKNDGFNSLVKKNYRIAPIAMLEAIDILEGNQNKYLKNDDNLATYNSTPSFKQALRYRVRKGF